MEKDFNLFRLVPYPLLFALFVGTGFSQLMWERNYGGAGYEVGQSVDQTTDEGYIVVGYTNSFGNSLQVYLVKTDSLGDTLWTRIYGGTGDDRGFSVQQTQDGGYIIAGFSTSFGNGSQIYLIKTDSLGDTLWTRTYGGTANEPWCSCVQQTTDGGYILAGGAYYFGDYDPVYLIKTDSLGDTLWTKNYGAGEGRFVQQTQDGGYIVAGSTGWDVLLIKADSLGDTLWTKTYGGTNLEYGYSVQQTTDEGYIVAGYSYNPYPDPYSQFYLVKTDSLGDTLWTRTYGGTEHYSDGYSVRQTQDGGYIVAGFSDAFALGVVYLIKTDSLGDTLWTKIYGETTYSSWGYSVQQTPDGGYILAGGAYSFGNGSQVYLIKTDEDGNSGVEDNNYSWHPPYTPHPLVLPNPFSSFTTVIGYEKERFILYDVSGRQVGSYWGDKIGSGLPAGVYFIMPEDRSFNPVRVVKVR
ncbi:hypothetical protein KAX97_14730 [candidate division WOR-3 bacterium]|nr:hypothetical protein [candidate division WOR-3 bacterium]